MYADFKHVNLHSDKMHLKLELKNCFSRKNLANPMLGFFFSHFYTFYGAERPAKPYQASTANPRVFSELVHWAGCIRYSSDLCGKAWLK